VQLVRGRPKKPLGRGWVVVGGIALALGVPVWIGGSLYMRSSLTGESTDAFFVGVVAAYVFGPLLTVIGAILLALGRSRPAWVWAGAAAVGLGALALGGMVLRGRELRERSCVQGNANSCAELGDAASTPAERSRRYEQACGLGDLRACVRFGKAGPEQMARATAAYRAFCQAHEADYRCGENMEDVSMVCTTSPLRWECQ
jgi:hypothetical protein